MGSDRDEMTSEEPEQQCQQLSNRGSVASVASTRSACVNLDPVEGDSKIFVTKNAKRHDKGKTIYVNARTGLPVRPPTSFGLFKYALRRSIKDSKISFVDFNKKASEKWAKMTDEQKAPYIERSRALASQYKRIEGPCLRKRVKQLQQQVKEFRQVAARYNRRR